MYINLNGKVKNAENYIKTETDEASYYVNGIFFIPGFKTGEESIMEFARRYENSGNIDFINCMGSFNFIIEKKDETVVFTDNGLSRCFFYNNRVMSDNILELIKNSGEIELDLKNVVQYMIYNKIFFNQTYIKDTLFTNNNYVYFIKNGEIVSDKKDIGNLESKQYAISAVNFSEILKNSMSNVNKVISLTGGFDSRYVLALLLGDKRLSTSISGTDKIHSDFIISKKVAEEARVEYKQEIIQKPDIDENYIKDMFLKRGGYFNIFNDGNFRLNEYLRRKKEENCQCLMTGDTGCFHKSEGFYPYFPFYRCKHYSVKRYYKQRYLGNERKLPLSSWSKKVAIDIEKEILDYLTLNKKAINTNNYDWQSWYFNKTSNYAPAYSGQSRLLNSYPPLLEYRFVINSYNLPRRQRMIATYMKKYITSVSINVARIPTVSKVTTSSEKRFVIHDLWYQMCQIFQSAFRLFGRIVFKKNFFVENLVDWSCQDELRTLDLSREALNFAYDENIFEKSWTIENVPYDILCKMLEIYLISEYSKGRF